MGRRILGLSLGSLLVNQLLFAAPSPPGSVTVTRSAYPQVKLAWSDVTNATTYLVRRDGQTLINTAGRTHIDYSRAIGTIHTYEVAAINAMGTSTFVAVICTVDTPNVFAYIPEAANYELVYALEIPEDAYFANSTPVSWLDDWTGSFTTTFDRVAYYFELETDTTQSWVYTSFDTHTPYIQDLGPPHRTYNFNRFQQRISNLNVFAEAGTGVTSGTNLTTGNIEMWSANYTPANAENVPNASGSAFDHGDLLAKGTDPGYGCFQVHNYDIDGTGPGTQGEVIFAYNRWSRNDPAGDDVGIGNNPSGEPDYTFEQNADAYPIKNLLILARKSVEPPLVGRPTNLLVTGTSVTHIDLSWDAVPGALEYHIRVDGTPWGIVRTPSFRAAGLNPNSTYSLEVAAWKGGFTPTSSPVVTNTRPLTIFHDVDELCDYTPIYILDIPNNADYRDNIAIPYGLDLGMILTQSFDRVAYFLELDDGGGRSWACATMEAFTTRLDFLGVPHHIYNVRLQRLVNDVNVYASAGANVSTGMNWSTGNIEMWSNAYNAFNDDGVPNASDSIFDAGDRYIGRVTGHGSFQVHLHDNGFGSNETIIAYNKWSHGTGNDDLGIGNQPTGHPDWTVAENAGNYSLKRLYVLARLSGGPDSDNDQLDDGWERKQFGYLGLDGDDDPDDDGAENRNEYIAGTTPTDPLDVFRVSIQRGSNNVFQLGFPGRSQRIYDARTTTSLLTPNWTNWVTGLPGFDGWIELPYTNTVEQQRYFRIDVEWP